jgi:hypothetical protein
VFVAAFAAVAVWLATTPAAYEAAIPEEVREAYLERDFEAYYSSEPGPRSPPGSSRTTPGWARSPSGPGSRSGSRRSWCCCSTAPTSASRRGCSTPPGDRGHFWGLILPHGLLELTAVFIAGRRRLRLGWAIVAGTGCGGVTRSPRRDAARWSIVIGLVAVFAIAGALEGYVTPAPWPTWARVGTGRSVWAAVCGWLVVAGAGQPRSG